MEKLGLNYPEKNWGDWARFWGPVPPGPNIEPLLDAFRGGSRIKYLGAWPIIIWDVTTAKRKCEITIEPITSTSNRTTVSQTIDMWKS